MISIQKQSNDVDAISSTTVPFVPAAAPVVTLEPGVVVPTDELFVCDLSLPVHDPANIGQLTACNATVFPVSAVPECDPRITNRVEAGTRQNVGIDGNGPDVASDVVFENR